MIEVNETVPVEASLTLVLRGHDVDMFKTLIWAVSNECWLNEADGDIATKIWEAINS